MIKKTELSLSLFLSSAAASLIVEIERAKHGKREIMRVGLGEREIKRVEPRESETKRVEPGEEMCPGLNHATKIAKTAKFSKDVGHRRDEIYKNYENCEILQRQKRARLVSLMAPKENRKNYYFETKNCNITKNRHIWS